MFDLGRVGAVVTLSDGPYRNTLNRLPGATQTAMQQVKQAMVRTLGVYGAIRLFKGAARASMDFGAELSNIGSIAQELSLSNIKQDILELNSILGKSKDLAFSYYYAYSGGVRGTAEELAKFTGQMAQMAKTIRAEQVPAMDSATSLMNAYNLKVKDAGMISDWFYTIVKRGKTTGQELASTLGLVVDSAATAGVPLKELGAAIATLTLTQPTSRAITSLNQVIVSFLDPSKAAKKAALELGIDLSAASLKALGLAGAMKDITEKAGDNVEALSEMFGNVRAFRAAAALAGTQAKNFQDILGEFEGNAGASLKAFGIQTENTATAWNTAVVDMNKAAIKFGDSFDPLTYGLAKATSAGSEFFGNLTQNKLAVTAAGIGIAVLAKSALAYIVQLVRMPGAVVSMSNAISANTGNMAANTSGITANNAALSRNMALRSGIGGLAGATGVGGGNLRVRAFTTGFLASQPQMIQESIMARLARPGGRMITGGDQGIRGIKGAAMAVRGLGRAGLSAAGKLSAMIAPLAGAALGAGALAVGTAAAGWEMGKMIAKWGGLEEKFGRWFFDMDKINERIGSLKKSEQELMKKREVIFLKRLEMLKNEGTITLKQYEDYKKGQFTEKKYSEIAQASRESKDKKNDPVLRATAELNKYFTESFALLEKWKSQDSERINSLTESLWKDDGKFSAADKLKLANLELETAGERLERLNKMRLKGSEEATEMYWKEFKKFRQMMESKKQLQEQYVNEEIKNFRSGRDQNISSMRSNFIMNDNRLDPAEQYKLANAKERAQKDVINRLETKIEMEKDEAILKILRDRRDKEISVYEGLVKSKESLDPQKQFASKRQQYFSKVLDKSDGWSTKEITSALEKATEAEKKMYSKSVSKRMETGRYTKKAAESLAFDEWLKEIKKSDTKVVSGVEKLSRDLGSLLEIFKNQKGVSVTL